MLDFTIYNDSSVTTSHQKSQRHIIVNNEEDGSVVLGGLSEFPEKIDSRYPI